MHVFPLDLRTVSHSHLIACQGSFCPDAGIMHAQNFIYTCSSYLCETMKYMYTHCLYTVPMQALSHIWWKSILSILKLDHDCSYICDTNFNDKIIFLHKPQKAWNSMVDG